MNLLIIMGDFNAKVGREECRHKASDKYSLHERSNENGFLLVQFAIQNNLYIKSTTFSHKTIHMGTWTILGSTEVNQIDHVLVSARHASFIIDVRNSRGANCDSDHYLVKVIVRERISRGWNQRVGVGNGRRKWNSEVITSP
jgi:endonuclease/exonuclease/phosphatase family metal-dependent hydrolase